MARMEKDNHLLDRIIAVFIWNNSHDLHMQHYMKLFNPDNNHRKVLEDHNDGAEKSEGMEQLKM